MSTAPFGADTETALSQSTKLIEPPPTAATGYGVPVAAMYRMPAFFESLMATTLCPSYVFSPRFVSLAYVLK